MLRCCHIAFPVINLHIVHELLHKGLLFLDIKGCKQQGIVNRCSLLQELLQKRKQFLSNGIEEAVIICNIGVDLIAVQHKIIIAFLICDIGQNLLLLFYDADQMRLKQLIIILFLCLMPCGLTVCDGSAILHVHLSWQYTQLIQLAQQQLQLFLTLCTYILLPCQLFDPLDTFLVRHLIEGFSRQDRRHAVAVGNAVFRSNRGLVIIHCAQCHLIGILFFFILMKKCF